MTLTTDPIPPDLDIALLSDKKASLPRGFVVSSGLVGLPRKRLRNQSRRQLHHVVRVIVLVRPHPCVAARRRGEAIAAVVVDVVTAGHVVARDVLAAGPAAVVALVLAVGLAVGLAHVLAVLAVVTTVVAMVAAVVAMIVVTVMAAVLVVRERSGGGQGRDGKRGGDGRLLEDGLDTGHVAVSFHRAIR